MIFKIVILLWNADTSGAPLTALKPFSPSSSAMAYLRYKGMVHLHRLQEDGSKHGLHHSKGMLYNGAHPGRMCV